MKIILLGPPGAGKGTQAKLISSRFNIPHISTGDIFRKNIREMTKLGLDAKSYLDKGLLVPDELTIEIVYNRLNERDCERCYLLDGFPRTLNQAKALQTLLESEGKSVDMVFLFEVSRETILERGTGRRICENCGASFHIKYNSSKVRGVCDFCGSNLIHREDDKEATILNRLELYENETKPLIRYYNEKDMLATIDGSLTIDSVFKKIENTLTSYRIKKGA